MENKISKESPAAAQIPNNGSQLNLELSKSEKFLKSLFSKASEKGYTPAQIVNQCIRIDQLERKYSKSYEDLRNDFDQLGREISARTRKVKELEERIAETRTKKADLMREYSVDEKSARAYVAARARLSSIGFQIDELPKVKTCLLSVKNEKFSHEAIIEKLNAIGDLEARKDALELELRYRKWRSTGKESAADAVTTNATDRSFGRQYGENKGRSIKNLLQAWYQPGASIQSF